MTTPITFPQKARPAMLDMLDQRRWSAVAEAVDAGYPLTVRNAKGQDFFGCFIEAATPYVDSLSLSWHSEIVRSMLKRGLSDTPTSVAGMRPISLAIQSLRWDIVALFIRHGHHLELPGERGAWMLLLDGFAGGFRSMDKKDRMWRFERTANLLLDQNIDPQPVFDAILSLGFDRLAVRIMDRGVCLEVAPNPSFEAAMIGSSPSVFFRILRDNEAQRSLVERGSREDVARWFSIISTRKDPDILKLLRTYLLPSMEKDSRPDQAASFIQSGWIDPLTSLLSEGLDLGSSVWDGRKLAHVAARYANEPTLDYLKAAGMRFDLAPDPWTGLDPAKTIAARFPDFQALPASVLAFRPRIPR